MAGISPRPQPRFTAHSIRGLIDAASPLGARWVMDEVCEDEFARGVKAAQEACLRFSHLPRPGLEGIPVGYALAGLGGSPSLVWHSQAVGCLLEFGYLPSANCIRQHLKILQWRLDPSCCKDPATATDQRDPWLLRTRHVAWVLACLAELPLLALDVNDDPGLRSEVERAQALHLSVILTAADYILGLSSDVPWTARDPTTGVWHEHWGASSPNLLNTVYASLGLCRAMRHGFVTPVGERADAVNAVHSVLDGLFERVVVSTERDKPEVHWEAPPGAEWSEPWAQTDLPDGVVGLLCLALLEYAGLLQETQAPRSWEETHGIAVRTKARRLAQTLLFRARDQSRESRDSPRWTTSADVFLRADIEGDWAEGEWLIASYSVCTRAVLETGVVGPRDETVCEAFATIGQWRISQPTKSGSPIETWIDPTRAPRVRRRARAAGKETWHAKIDLQGVFQDGVDRPREPHPTASGIHAAAMAYASLRRAAAGLDPRDLLPGSGVKTPLGSVFRSIRIAPHGRRYRMSLSGDGDDRDRYSEHATISLETRLVFEGLAAAGTCAPRQDILARIAERVAVIAPGRVKYVKEQSSLDDRIEKLNRRFGCLLIERDESEEGPLYTLACELVRG